MNEWRIELDEKRTNDELHRKSSAPGEIGELNPKSNRFAHGSDWSEGVSDRSHEGSDWTFESESIHSGGNYPGKIRSLAGFRGRGR
jgi:hypothetical protein